MDQEFYNRCLAEMFTVGRNLLELEHLPRILDMIQRAEDVGCFVDPTLWRKGHAALEQHKEICLALMEAQGKIRKARAALAPIIERQLEQAAMEAESS